MAPRRARRHGHRAATQTVRPGDIVYGDARRRGRRTGGAPRPRSSTACQQPCGHERPPPHDRRRQLSAAGLADRPDAPRQPAAAARPRAGALAGPRGFPRAGAGRRDAARDPRHGARRHRHRQRRRDPPRELLEPLRHGARGHRHRQPGRRDRPHRPREPGAARSRARSGGRDRSRCATSSSCGRTPIGKIKITLPGPFTMAQQAQNDHYPDEESARARLRRRGERGGARPEGGRRRRRCRSTSRTCRRARSRPAPTASRRSTVRSTASTATPRCTSASATATSSGTSRPATRSSPS